MFIGRLTAAAAGLAVSLSPAVAADAASPRAAPPSAPVWSGLYIGGHLGGGAGTTQVANPFGPSLYGDAIRAPSVFAGVQAGYNWQVPSSNVVFGVEADVSAMDANATSTCLAGSGDAASANCRVRYDATGSITGRIGVTAGPDGRSLVYIKGGAAWLASRFDMAANAFPDWAVAETRGTRWGWTVGAGYEQALTPAWSIRFEYNHTRFDGGEVTSPPVVVQTQPPPLPVYATLPGAPASFDHSQHLFRIGLNYRIGSDPHAAWDAPALAVKARGPAVAPGWQVEAGARYWYSSGRFQKDLGITTNPAQQNVLISRLTYDSTAHSGELFGRIDTPSRVFIKGLAGGGSLTSGRMYDEDWLIHDGDVPYSNTLSGRVGGSIAYATIDIGYDVLRTDSARVGAFVGYNYYRDDKVARGCIQIANPAGACGGAGAMPLSADIITEDDKWHALRLGVAGEVALLPGLKLGAEAAYLPYVRMTGLDGHLLRDDEPSIWSPEFGKGQGMQLEAILSYALTPNFNIGIGGRYWAMWATHDAYTNAFGRPCPDCQTLPSRTDRYGMFLQASYRFEPGASRP